MTAPSGTVTFLFTDVEGSTALWRDVPAAMGQALEQHDGLLREVVGRFDGYVFTTAGDSFAVAFARADSAFRCAIEIQRAIAAASWPVEGGLRVRMGLHAGEALERDGDYFGPAVNLAARVMGVAAGGQILVSTAARAVVADALRGELTLRDLGLQELKGIGDPVRLLQVEADGLDSDFPPLLTGAAVGNLPRQDELLIGRDRDLELVRRLLEESRVCTVVGVGGIGKTRLALSAAAGLSDNWGDGVWLVELAPIGDEASLPQAVADAIGCRQHVGRTVTESVAEFFRRRDALLVLDNCEHVLDAAGAFVATLLSSALGVQVLATSREALGVRSEQTYPLPSLETGDPESAGETLFQRRAGEVAPQRSWDDDQLAAIGKICQRLDGIPLAIELAASRCRSMTPVDIADRLDTAFLDLRGGRRSVERHRTLKAAIDWSHDALDDNEKAVFARLSVFAGGWDLHAAESVATSDDVDPGEVFDLLDSLVSRSLVVTATGAGGVTRFRMLEPVRQYAEDQLANRNESAATRDAHLAWAVAWAAEWTRQLPIEDRSWRDALVENIPNLRTAVEWGCHHHRADDLLRLLDNVIPAQQLFQRYEIGRWAELALQVSEVRQHPRVAFAYSAAIGAAWWRGEMDRALEFGTQERRASAADPTMFYPAVGRAAERYFSGDLVAASELLRAARPRTDWEIAFVLFLRFEWSLGSGPDHHALRALDEQAKRTLSALPEAIYRNHLAQMLLISGRVEESAQAAWRAFEAASSIGTIYFVNHATQHLVKAAEAIGVLDPRTASTAAAVLRDMSDSGQKLDQWLIIGPMAYPLWRLGHRRLSSAISQGFADTIWGRTAMRQTHDLAGERAEFERERNRSDADISQEALVDAILVVLDEIATEPRTTSTLRP